MKNYRQKSKKAFYGWIGIIVIILILLMNSCCMAQIPTQYYFATDSCEFYLPDYSQIVEVRDNCCVNDSSFVQVPNSGTLLTPGTEVTVTLFAIDCYGNQSSMTFDVVVIDKVPPTFHYDSADFAPLGMYQNDVRTWHLWTDAEPNINELDPPLYYSHTRAARDRTTGIGTEIHDAFYRADNYYKMSLFMAQSTYRIMDMYMALAKVGNPQGELHVEVWQLNMVDTSLLQPICGTKVPLSSIGERISSNPQNVPAEELTYYTVDVSDGVLVKGGWYAIRTHCTGVDNDNRVIWNTTNFEDGDPYKFLKYSYDGEETYGVNPTSSYMYQIHGIDIV